MAELEDAALLSSLRRFVTLASPQARRRDCWREALLVHPKYPTAAAVIDALRPLGLNCAAVRAEVSGVADLPLPSLLHLHAGQFAVLENVTADSVLWTHPRSGRQRVTFDQLREAWTGVALIVDAITDPTGDCAKRGRPGAQSVLVMAALATLALAAGAADRSDATAVILLVLHAIGTAVALALSAESKGKHTELMSALCPAGAASDCRHVLNSAAGSFLGISTADWAAGYFICGWGSFVIALISGAQLVPLWAWVAALTVPVAVVSIIAQAVVIRAWCAGCLIVDAVLFIQALLAWPHRAAASSQSLQIVTAGLCIAALLLAAARVIPAGSLQASRRYMRLRREPAVLAGLLSNTPPLDITGLPQRLIAGVGNLPVAVTLIASPYCPACAETHAELHALTTTSAGVRTAIIFLCDVGQNVAGTRAVIAAQALAIAHRSDEAHELIGAWYSDLRAGRTFDERRLNAVYDTLPPEAVAGAQRELRALQQWVFTSGINATPVVLLYGRRLPAHYGPGELRDIDLGAVARLLVAPGATSSS